MARKTRSSRRPGQGRPPAAPQPRRTATHAAPESIEERLAQLEREREALLAAAAHPETIHPEDDGSDGTDADTEAPGATAAEPPNQSAPPRPTPARTQPQPPRRTLTTQQPAGARRVGRITPTAVTPRTAAAQPARGVPARAADTLDPVDPSIPLAQVPYVRADLRRVATIAAVMVALIIVADIIVSNVVK